MDFTDEKDYIMRIIKEMVRVLFSLVFGKKYVSVEIEKENKITLSQFDLKEVIRQTIFSISDNENNKLMTDEQLRIENNTLPRRYDIRPQHCGALAPRGPKPPRAEARNMRAPQSSVRR